METKQSAGQKVGRACGYIMYLWYVMPLLLGGILMMIIASYIARRKYIVVEATATGETHVITESEKSEPIVKYMVEYVVDGRIYPHLIVSDFVLKNGDKVSVYVDSKKPAMLFMDNPKKIPSILYGVGSVCIILFIIATYVVYKYPHYVCGAGGTWTFLSWFAE